MKRPSRSLDRSPRSRAQHRSPRRGGAVIIVVISLLATLVFLGLFFYNWTSQERINATFYAEEDPVEIDPDPIFNFGLRQTIVSVPSGFTNSALYGEDGSGNGVTFYSLLAHQVGPINTSGGMASGASGAIHDGAGVAFSYPDSDGNKVPDISIDVDGDMTPDYPGFRIDFDRDGLDEVTNTSGLVLNRSAIANNGTAHNDGAYFFEPDVGYTYPDIHALFLAVDYFEPASGVRIVKPSFTLPGYFPVNRFDGGFGDFYKTLGTNTANANQSLRPHESHLFQPPSGPSGTTTDDDRRYPTSSILAESGDRNRIIEPFPMNGGTWGIWEDLTGATGYDFGKDVDNDGVDDAVAIDHDHPLINLPNGDQVIPIYYWKIIDLDSLLNTNLHGNQAVMQANSNAGDASPFLDSYGASEWAHYSNMGLSPAEVNLSIGLFGDPTSTNHISVANRNYATSHLRGYVAERHNGVSTIDPPNDRAATMSRLQTANLETTMMLYGRPEVIPQDLRYESNTDLIGRYGSDGDLRGTLELGGVTPLSGQLACPGTRGTDENADDGIDTNDGSETDANRTKGGFSYVDSRLNVVIPPFIHPLDYSGRGDGNGANESIYLRGAGVEGERLLDDINANSPIHWPSYPMNGLWQDPGTSTSSPLYYNPPPAPTYAMGFGFKTYPIGLFPNAGDALFNDPGEFHPYAAMIDNNDEMFHPREIAALQLSELDWRDSGLKSRLRRLMPFNFELSRQAPEIRKQFTTDSWDRSEFTMTLHSGVTRAWEFNNSGKFPPAAQVLTSAEATASTFENVDSSNVAGTYISPNIRIHDPIRPEVRRLLTVDPTVSVPDRKDFPQLPLLLNRIISDDALFTTPYDGDLAAFDENGNPRYRNLVPHVQIFSSNVPIEAVEHDHFTDPLIQGMAPTHPIRNFNNMASDPAIQEWWARYDRQRLARDIYTLLYFLGGGDDSFDPTSGPYPVNTDVNGDGVDDFVNECAQFAVNYVDAMDRDQVVTRFEYDTNLSDGWSDTIAPPTPYSVVFGVEQQSLTFSEVLCIRTAQSSTDSNVTLVNDQDDNHEFLYVELRNASPYTVEFAEEAWRIVRMTTGGVEQAEAKFHPNAGGSVKSVLPGENFLFGCHDGTVVNGAGSAIGSPFYANFDNSDNDLECVIPKNAPKVADNNATPGPITNFDLDANERPQTATSGDKFVTFTMLGGFTGSTLVETTNPGDPVISGSADSFVLSLQRRQNLDALGSGESSWIEVDRITVTKQPFYVKDSVMMTEDVPPSSASEVQTALSRVKSTERTHAFTGQTNQNSGSADQNHSMDNLLTAKHATNTTGSSAESELWHPHFDRDFSSTYELLAVPLYGVQEHASPSTFHSSFHGGTVRNLTSGNFLTGHRTAQARFFYPDPADIPASSPWFASRPTYKNRWYRLLNFVEVDSRADDAIDARMPLIRRIPGRINLNGLRHEHVLAAIIDDDIHHDAITNRDDPTQDVIDGTRRWINEFLATRDVGHDLSNFIQDAPGTPFSRPFKPLSNIDVFNPEASAEFTMLRHGNNGVPLSNVGLFEARPIRDFNGGGDDDIIDYHSRNRLLAKVANNSTTRSHVFAIWVGFDLHRAHIDSATSNVQIGARATEYPTYRQFLVVDMSRLEEAFDPGSGTFDYRKFIIHRQMLP